MPDQFAAALSFLGLLDGVVLYERLIRRRVHERRIQKRLHETAHLSGLVRVTLAAQRSVD